MKLFRTTKARKHEETRRINKKVLRVSLCVCVFAVPCFLQAQEDSIFTEARSRALVDYLASDSLKGRMNYTPEQQQAAYFLADEFMRAGLKPYFGNSYLQVFSGIPPKEGQLLSDSLRGYNPERLIANVAGVLPGKSKPHEVVVFSAHYDHIGTDLRKWTQGRSPKEGTIFNGANDNASGTAALVLLAQHFARLGNNERTLVFCAFAGEELGLLGSSHFVQQLEPDSIITLLNLDMLGRYRPGGKNRFFVTGAGYSDLQPILRKNLKGDKVVITHEPDPEKNLFGRSDNYPFALKGIPAHSLMSSDDDDACYHLPCDEAGRIDHGHLVRVVQAIARAAGSIISGADTPARIRPERIQ